MPATLRTLAAYQAPSILFEWLFDSVGLFYLLTFDLNQDQ
jgi:hypothetical protein